MFYKDIQHLKPHLFKRCTGVKKEVFLLMLEVVDKHKKQQRKHPSRGTPPKLTNADKILLMLMYYREYRTQFHIGLTYGISESRVCEIIQETESILIQDERFHLPGKKALLNTDNNFEVVLIDVTESPIERPKKNSETIIQGKRSDTPKKRK
jgi:Helix-turn-helix of DDE superfamily endonuclease